MTAGFELIGTAQTGGLTLYTPLGSTAAALSWSPGAAELRANGDVRHFDSLGALLREAVGTELPVAALFDWVAGKNQAGKDWSADLSDYTQGRIKARRQEPGAAAELNLILEK